MRAAYKHYLKEYTPGAFKLILVPADNGHDMIAKFDGQPFAFVRKMASKKTGHGYTVEMDMHFRSNLVETPGWVAGREVRVGVLVNHGDDAGKDRACALGLWRTTADAPTDCSSLTTMTLQK